LEYKEIIQSIRKKQYKPVYFLHGEEPYFIDAITDVIEHEILDEGMKSFNQVVLYGKDVDSMTVVDNARRYPMMSPIQVVIVKEAQNMSSLTQLQKYIETPLSSTILLIAHKHKKLDGRSAFAKSLVKNAVVFESKPLYENQIPDFIRNWLKDHKMTIAADAMDMMVEYLGMDLGKIINELEKLQLNLKSTDGTSRENREGGQITTEHIEKYIGISREYNVFELQKAIGARNILHANRIAKYFHENPKDAPFVMVIGNLYNYFSKIYQLSFLTNQSPNDQIKTLGLRSEWFLKDYSAALRQYPRSKLENIFALLREFDLKAKGVNADGVEEGELMKELVYKILH
jgi:DNA polymerase III subunit delta